MEVVFLGANNAGFAIYDWLCERDDVTVHALLTRPDQLSLIESLEPDIVVAAGFDHVVPSDVLDVPEQGCLNIHIRVGTIRTSGASSRTFRPG